MPKFYLLYACLCSRLLSDGFEYAIILPTLWPYLQSQGCKISYIGWVLGGYAFGGLISAPVVGWLSDKFPKHQKKLLLGGGMLSILGNLIYFVAPSKEFVLLGRFFCGFGVDPIIMAEIGRVRFVGRTSDLQKEQQQPQLSLSEEEPYSIKKIETQKQKYFSFIYSLKQLGFLLGPICVLFMAKTLPLPNEIIKRNASIILNEDKNTTLVFDKIVSWANNFKLHQYNTVGLLVALVYSFSCCFILFFYNSDKFYYGPKNILPNGTSNSSSVPVTDLESSSLLLSDLTVTASNSSSNQNSEKTKQLLDSRNSQILQVSQNGNQESSSSSSTSKTAIVNDAHASNPLLVEENLEPLEKLTLKKSLSKDFIVGSIKEKTQTYTNPKIFNTAVLIAIFGALIGTIMDSSINAVIMPLLQKIFEWNETHVSKLFIGIAIEGFLSYAIIANKPYSKYVGSRGNLFFSTLVFSVMNLFLVWFCSVATVKNTNWTIPTFLVLTGIYVFNVPASIIGSGTLISSATSKQFQGKAQSLRSMAQNMGYILGPIVSTYVFDSFGSGFVWIVPGFLSILLLLFIVRAWDVLDSNYLKIFTTER